MGLPNNNARSLVGRLLASAGFQNPQREKELRLDAYGDLFTVPSLPDQAGGALSGSYLTATNPTIGTAIVTTTSITAFTAVSPVAAFFNAGVNGRSIVMDYLSMRIQQVPTSATRWLYTWVVDPVDRYTSGGTLLVPTNTNSGVDNTSIMRFHFGAIVATAASASVRRHSNGLVRDVIPLIDDSTTFRFNDRGANGSLVNAAGGVQYIAVPPMVIAPGHTGLLYLFGDSNAAAPTWEFTAGWYER
jgi:hypothetical protein